MDIMSYVRAALVWLLGKTYKATPEPTVEDIKKTTDTLIKNNEKSIKDLDALDEAIQRAKGQ